MISQMHGDKWAAKEWSKRERSQMQLNVKYELFRNQFWQKTIDKTLLELELLDAGDDIMADKGFTHHLQFPLEVGANGCPHHHVHQTLSSSSGYVGGNPRPGCATLFFLRTTGAWRENLFPQVPGTSGGRARGALSLGSESNLIIYYIIIIKFPFMRVSGCSFGIPDKGCRLKLRARLPPSVLGATFWACE